MTRAPLKTIPPLPTAFDLIDLVGPAPATAGALRDLAWLLFAPDPLAADTPLLAEHICPTSWREARQAQWLQRLQQLAQRPQPLLQVLESVPRRLGLYAEALLGFWLEHDPQLQLIARHQPLREGKRTLGDFDFILRSPEQGTIHLELAVKFFLGLPGASSPDHWVGTTLDDSLGIKGRHIVEHQLQLSHHPAAHRLLSGPVQQRWCWFKGWMFHPLMADIGLASVLAADHCRGVWGTAAQLLAHWGLEAEVDYLPLQQRLAPARRQEACTTTLSPLIAAWRSEPWPRLLARFQLGAAGYEEAERAWLVPDDWLQRATGGGFCP